MANTYEVQQGDSPWAIWRDQGPKASGMSFDDFLAMNGMNRNDAMIHPGDSVALSDGPETAQEPSPETTPEEPAPEEEPTAEAPGIMGGGTLTKVVRPNQDDLWVMMYDQGGVSHAFAFDSHESMLASLGPDAITSGTYGFQQITEGAYDAGITNGTIFNMGSATPLVGQTGTYATMYADTTRDAAIAAGVRNPGALGDYLADPDVARLMAAATAGGWTPEQLQAEIRNTNYYQNVMYPGIATILDSNTSQPEAAWRSYYGSVEDSLQSLGYPKDADGSYKSQVGKLLGKGISDTVFNKMAPVYVRAKNSPGFATALDYWMDQTAGRNVTFDDIFDAISGESSGDLAQAVESATIQFQANKSNLALSDAQIKKIAEQTQLSEPEIQQAFTTAEQNLLALGDRGLERYGLTQDMLTSAAFGLSTGDQSAVEIRQIANKTMKEIGLQDDKKAQFFASFNERGALIKPGLTAVSPEGG